MTDNPVATIGAAMAVDDGGDALTLRLDGVAQAMETLESELLHSYEQLNSLFALSGQLSALEDPDAIQNALLAHHATMLRAGAMFVDQGGCCRRVELPDALVIPVSHDTQGLRAALAEQIETIRQNRRVTVIDGIPQLSGARALLGTLLRSDNEPAVVIALRDAAEPAFDYSNVLASESVLVYGAQLVRNALMVRSLRQSAIETVGALVNAIDAKDGYTSDHSERVGWLARLTGEKLGMSRDQLQTLEWAGLLHDVGKIGVSERILNKPGRLTDSEFEQMKAHPRIGFDTLRPVERFQPVLGAVLHHHENHDGSGYPSGIAGDEIPMEARVIHVVDVFDALTTDRPYRKGFSFDRAISLIHDDAGRVTDPVVAQAFVDAVGDYMGSDAQGFRTRFGHLFEDGVLN